MRRIVFYALTLFSFGTVCSSPVAANASVDARSISGAIAPHAVAAARSVPALLAGGSKSAVLSMTAHQPYGLSALSTYRLNTGYIAPHLGASIAIQTFGDDRYRETSGELALGVNVISALNIGVATEYTELGVSGVESTRLYGGTLALAWRGKSMFAYASHQRKGMWNSGPLAVQKTRTTDIGGGYFLKETIIFSGFVSRDNLGRTRTEFGADAWIHPRLAIRLGRASGPHEITGGCAVRAGRYLIEYTVRLHRHLDPSHAATLSLFW